MAGLCGGMSEKEAVESQEDTDCEASDALDSVMGP